MAGPIITPTFIDMPALKEVNSDKLVTAHTKPVEDMGNFANELKVALDKISAVQNSANSQAERFEKMETGVSLNEVMVAQQKSTVALQFGIQVRNKLVSAYKEIMNMTV